MKAISREPFAVSANTLMARVLLGEKPGNSPMKSFFYETQGDGSSPFRFACMVALVTVLTALAWPSASHAQLWPVGTAAIRQFEPAPADTIPLGLVSLRLEASLAVDLDDVIPTVTGVREERPQRWKPDPRLTNLGHRERRARELTEAGTGLFRWTRSGLRLARPQISVLFRAKDTRETLRLGGLKPRQEIRITLFSGVF